MHRKAVFVAAATLGLAAGLARAVAVVDNGKHGWMAWLDGPALVTTLVVAAGAFWIFRRRMKKDLLAVGLACLAAVPMLVVAEWLALVGSPSYENDAALLRTTLLGMLYPLVAFGAFALAGYVRRVRRGEMVFREPSGRPLPESFNPLAWRQMVQ